MYPPHYLQWFHEDRWCIIGWTARDPMSSELLRQHGDALAKSNPGLYRLVVHSVRDDRDWEIVRFWSTSR